MKKVRPLVAFIISALIACSLLAGCAKSTNPPPAQSDAANSAQAAPSATASEQPAASQAAPAAAVKNPDTMVIATEAEPTTLDPAIAYDPSSSAAILQTYEGLVTYKDDTSEVVPWLAESWDVTEEGKVWTFHLKHGVNFSDGTPFNAEAVKVNFDRELSINQGPAWIFDMVNKVEAVDEYTVRITMDYPYVPFLQAMASNYGVLFISPKAIKDHETSGDLAQAWLKQNMVGTGPYTLEGWTLGQGYTMVKNPNYWGGWDGKHVSKIEAKVVKESSSQLLMLESGDADFATGITLDTLPQISNNPDIEIIKKPTVNTLHIYWNNQRGAMADKKVRQAMAYGFSYDDAINGVYSGMASKMTGPMASGMWGYDDTLVPYTYDVNKAKQLLSDAGYANGGGLKFTLLVETGADDYEKVSEVFQGNMADLGIKIDIQRLAWATMKDMLSKPETSPDMVISGFYPDYADPDDVLYLQYNTTQIGNINYCLYSKPETDKLLEQARKITDNAQRTAIYKQIQQIINDDCPMLYVLVKDGITTKRVWVKNYVFNPLLEKTYYRMYKE